MKDWLFTGNDYICDLRAAGILVRNDKILLQRDHNGQEYALPGGHVRIGEIMTDSLIREFMEEMAAEITCERLLWTEECFWESNSRKVHSIAFYYLVALCPGADIPDNGEFFSQRDNCNVLLGWVPIEEVDGLTIYPEFIKKMIHELNAPAAHFVTHA